MRIMKKSKSLPKKLNLKQNLKIRTKENHNSKRKGRSLNSTKEVSKAETIIGRIKGASRVAAGRITKGANHSTKGANHSTKATNHSTKGANHSIKEANHSIREANHSTSTEVIYPYLNTPFVYYRTVHKEEL
jgi:hypothetical protein